MDDLQIHHAKDMDGMPQKSRQRERLEAVLTNARQLAA